MFKLDAVISMPSGVFKPYAGVSTAILVFTKTGSGGTDRVWFYDMKAAASALMTSVRRFLKTTFRTLLQDIMTSTRKMTGSVPTRVSSY